MTIDPARLTEALQRDLDSRRLPFTTVETVLRQVNTGSRPVRLRLFAAVAAIAVIVLTATGALAGPVWRQLTAGNANVGAARAGAATPMIAELVTLDQARRRVDFPLAAYGGPMPARLVKTALETSSGRIEDVTLVYDIGEGSRRERVGLIEFPSGSSAPLALGPILAGGPGRGVSTRTAIVPLGDHTVALSVLDTTNLVTSVRWSSALTTVWMTLGPPASQDDALAIAGGVG
jgi:hypothetical protein